MSIPTDVLGGFYTANEGRADPYNVAMSLAKGEVTLAEARTELGGRVTHESALTGLAQWARVKDWRLNQLDKLPNVDFYLDSLVDEDQILEFAADQVALATGSTWRRDGVGRWHDEPISGWDGPTVMTPDDIMSGTMPTGPVVVYDDDHYYIGGVIAETLRAKGLDVTLVTPANEASTWTTHTEEQFRIQERLLTVGINLITGTSLAAVTNDSATLECIYTGKITELAAASVVMTTSRMPNDALYHQLADRIAITRIGDCLAPGTIATSVYSGHRYAREMDTAVPVGVPFGRER